MCATFTRSNEDVVYGVSTFEKKEKIIIFTVPYSSFQMIATL